MPGLIVGDVLQININTTLLNQQTINTFFYRCTSPGTGSVSVNADIIGAMAYFETGVGGVYAPWRACVPVTNIIKPITGQLIKPHRSVRINRVPANVVGGRGDANTPNLSAVLTRGTDSGERGQVGSIHLPGVAELDQSNGDIDPALGVLMTALGTAVLNPIVVAITLLTLEPVLYHPDIFDTAGILIRPWFTTPLTRTIVQPEIRVMRRRTTGKGV